VTLIVVSGAPGTGKSTIAAGAAGAAEWAVTEVCSVIS
jgi:broad-specificity NMP kinase